MSWRSSRRMIQARRPAASVVRSPVQARPDTSRSVVIEEVERLGMTVVCSMAVLQGLDVFDAKESCRDGPANGAQKAAAGCGNFAMIAPSAIFPIAGGPVELDEFDRRLLDA